MCKKKSRIFLHISASDQKVGVCKKSVKSYKKIVTRKIFFRVHLTEETERLCEKSTPKNGPIKFFFFIFNEKTLAAEICKKNDMNDFFNNRLHEYACDAQNESFYEESVHFPQQDTHFHHIMNIHVGEKFYIFDHLSQKRLKWRFHHQKTIDYVFP